MRLPTASRFHATILLAGLALLSSVAPLQGQGNVFRVDAFFACDADQPDVTALPDGGFAVVWTSEGREIALRRYRVDLQPTGPGQLVTQEPPVTAAAIGDLAVAAAADGTVAVAWTDDQPRLLARLYDAAGAPLTDVLQLAAGGPDPELDLVALPDSSFVVVWQRDVGPRVVSLDALRFDRTGRELGRFEVIRVLDFSSNGFERARQPSVAVLGEDRLVISFNHRLMGFPFPFTDVRHRVFTFDGQLLHDAPTSMEGSVPVVAARSGGFVQLWRYSSSIRARGFDEQGRARGPVAPLRPIGEVVVSAPDLAFSSRGVGHAVWEVRTGALPPTAPSPPGEIRLRRLTSDGRPFGVPEALNFGLGSLGSDGAPRIAGLADGGVVVVGRHALAVGPADPVPCDAEHGILAKVVPDDELVLADRFRMEVEWHDAASGDRGAGIPGPRTTDTGSFWFFEPDNLELIVKIVDGRTVNDHFWFFYGALTNVGYEITVTDLVTGQTREYENPPGRLASFADTFAFRDEGSGASVSPAGLEMVRVEGAGHPPDPPGANPVGPCSDPRLLVASRRGLCLQGRRFEVEVAWHDPRSGDSGIGRPIPVNDVTGAFWFFDPDNVELVVKVIDGRPVNGRFWVLYGSLTDVEYTLRVRHVLAEPGDVEPGSSSADQVLFENAPFEFRSGADTTSLTPPVERPESCACPLVLAPVCGFDGVTYSNSCFAFCEGWVAVDHPGSCEEP